MKVRPGRVAGRTDASNVLPSLDGLPRMDQRLRKVPVIRAHSASVRENNSDASPPSQRVPPGAGDHTIPVRVNRRSHRGRKVNTRMHATVAGNAERRREPPASNRASDASTSRNIPHLPEPSSDTRSDRIGYGNLFGLFIDASDPVDQLVARLDEEITEDAADGIPNEGLQRANDELRAVGKPSTHELHSLLADIDNEVRHAVPSRLDPFTEAPKEAANRQQRIRRRVTKRQLKKLRILSLDRLRRQQGLLRRVHALGAQIRGNLPARHPERFRSLLSRVDTSRVREVDELWPLLSDERPARAGIAALRESALKRVT